MPIFSAIDGSSDLLPIDMILKDGPHADCVDVGARKVSGNRKLVTTLNGKDLEFCLDKEEMTIGRGKANDIRIPSHFVSRLHAKVLARGIGTVIEDAGSKNGILVNSERVNRRALRDGDIVSLGGELDLKFVDARP
jgi:pSer/pThr/pTyr-binding forkhead associated (FHA) protein